MNNQEKPLVSVIIPVHNCELYLAEAIQSVLQQSYNPIEVIVVDDGSTDTSAQVAKNFPTVSVLQKPCGGTGSARNHGIASAHGEFIAHLDADDIWIEDKIARQIQAFSEQPELDVVSGHLENFYSPDVANKASQLAHLAEGIIGGYSPSATMVRKRVFEIVGLFSTQWKLGNDFDWHLRATEAGLKMKTLDELVVRRRIHLTNSNIINREFETDRVKILKASLDRRRRMGNS